MELQYIEVKNWDKLKEDDIIIFKLPEKQMKYYVSIGGTFCVNSNNSNDEIFRYLNLNAKSFVESIVGYKCPCGVWPIVKSIDDLKKVIKALDDECIKKFGMSNTPKFKVGDKVRILPRIGNKNDYIGVYTDVMLQLSGKIATIKKIHGNSTVELDNNSWVWDPKALKLVDEKEEPETMDINQAKDGDYLSITNNNGKKYIVIFRNIEGTCVTRYANYSLSTNDFHFNPLESYGYCILLKDITRVNYATEEEKQLLDSKLLEAGYRWNNSIKELEAISSSTTSINMDKPETQFEAELNLFPTKKHYQLNFNY